MFEIDPARLAAAMERARINQSQLAELSGLKQPSIGRLLSGETKTSRAILKIAEALDVTPGYLAGEAEGSESVSPLRFADRRLGFRGHERDDTVELDEIDLAFGLGGTYLDVPVKAEKQAFSRAWLRHFTDSAPANLYFARGNGDSMMPTILDSDLLLIDKSQVTPVMSDQLWAIGFGDVGMIKRLRPMPDGSVKILSDNPNVPPEVAHDGEMQVFGRVVAVVRKM